MKLLTAPYLAQVQGWPQRGRHILAQFDTDSVIVYQAYRPAIGHYAVQHQTFGGEFSFTRMSWLKTNFLWMMYRSGWGTKIGQEVILAIRIQRAGFEQFLRAAVPSSFAAEVYSDQAAWEDAVAHSAVRLQWDPDHDPSGAPVARRAIQLGLRDEMLVHYAQNWVIEIEDISAFVAEQRRYAQTRATYAQLYTPCETVYPIVDVDTARHLGISGDQATQTAI